MHSVKELQEKHIEFNLDCFDRLYFNLYCPMLCSLGGIASIIRHVLNWGVPSPAAFKPLRDEFVQWAELYAEERGLKIHRFTNQETQSKESIARQHLQTWEGEGSDVIFIGKAQEKVKAPQASSKPSKANPKRSYVQLRYGKVMANQYYFYFWDDDWGMGFIKFSSYAPFAGRFYINGHEYVKRQLEKKGIAFEALDNGIGWCEDPKEAQRIARSITATKLNKLIHKWLGRVPNPLKGFPSRSCYKLQYKVSILQAEIALTQLWDKASHGLQFFEQVIRENIDLGRPEKVALIFDKRVTKRTREAWKFASRVFTEGVIPVFHIFYKSNKLKQYFKEAKALRNELTVNNPRDFGINKTLNTENLTALRQVGLETIERLLRVETLSHDPSVSLERVAQIESATEVAGRRVSPLPRSNTRVRALFNAMVSCHLISNGFRNRDLRARMAHLQGKDPAEISSGQMSYDLRRLRGHGLVRKVEGSHRYEVTEEGLHLALFVSRVERRVYRDGLAEVFAPDEGSGRLRQTLSSFDREVEKLMSRHLVLPS